MSQALRAAVAWTAQAARLPWPPTAPGPVPLDRCINALQLMHDEIAPLTSRHAGEHLRRYGVVRPALARQEKLLAGFLFANQRGGAILVNREDALPRRRFSAAHELGHYVLHFLPLTAADAVLETQDEDIDDQGATDSADAAAAQREQEANRFAAELLMPAALCQRLCQQYQARFGRAAGASARFLEHHLASDLLVSREAIRVRLRQLALVPPPC